MPSHPDKPNNVLIQPNHDGGFVVQTNVDFNGKGHPGEREFVLASRDALNDWIANNL